MRTSIPLAIADHAVVGDLHTVALVGLDATIDFLCLPRLDGPSVFASLLDPGAGSFRIEPELDSPRLLQTYLPDTNVVLTRMLDDERICEVTDFMVVGQPASEPILVRVVRSLRGTVRVRATCAPRFDYARASHETVRDDDAVAFRPADGVPPLRLVAGTPLAIEDGAAVADFELAPGASQAFVFGVPCDGVPPLRRHEVAAYVEDVLATTTDEWRAWSKRSRYTGRWRELVMRSALTLKLLVSKDQGSIAAAATFGLPEVAGGERNWDYRFAWIRDASFAAYAFIRLGYVDEALALMSWFGETFVRRDITDPLPPMYRLDGSGDLAESELDFAGYRDSRPVRIGNGAAGQLQLDVYGALMDTAYLTSKYGGAMSLDAWRSITARIDWLCKHWRDPDEGIWESRNGRRPYLHSRVMSWVAVDRAVRLAEKRSLPAPFDRWNDARSAIHRSILDDFWNAELEAFVREKGGDEVDASTLMLPLVRFISARDPRWRSTQRRIESQLIDDALVYRYRRGDAIDGLRGDEGAFATCSFWFAECLARQGDVPRAEAIFEKAASFGNHVGLFAEEFARNGDQLGNFPQALTHLALISAATAIDRAASGRDEPWSN